MCSNLDLIIQDHDSMCKVLSITLERCVHTLYNNLESNSIEGFNDLYAKLVAHFRTSIPTKKNAMELFSVAQ